MDGQTLLREVRQLLNEPSGSSFLNDRMTYDFLYEAAVLTTIRTQAFRSEQSITTIASNRNYGLNPDFIALYLMDDSNKRFIKYTASSTDHFLYERSYDNIILQNNTTPVTIPYGFTIKDKSVQTQISSTATSTAATTNGECTLNDTTQTFSSTCAVGDIVSNITDGSTGIVLEVVSNIAIKVSLFDGTNNDWTVGDSYIINPQGRFEVVFDPPPTNSGDIITIYYIQRPNPVYASYRRYNFPIDYKAALVHYAAWKYKYVDQEVNFGDKFYLYWDMTVRRLGANINNVLNRRGFKVNMIKRAGNSGTFR